MYIYIRPGSVEEERCVYTVERQSAMGKFLFHLSYSLLFIVNSVMTDTTIYTDAVSHTSDLLSSTEQAAFHHSTDVSVSKEIVSTEAKVKSTPVQESTNVQPSLSLLNVTKFDDSLTDTVSTPDASISGAISLDITITSLLDPGSTSDRPSASSSSDTTNVGDKLIETSSTLKAISSDTNFIDLTQKTTFSPESTNDQHSINDRPELTTDSSLEVSEINNNLMTTFSTLTDMSTSKSLPDHRSSTFYTTALGISFIPDATTYTDTISTENMERSTVLTTSSSLSVVTATADITVDRTPGNAQNTSENSLEITSPREISTSLRELSSSPRDVSTSPTSTSEIPENLASTMVIDVTTSVTGRYVTNDIAGSIINTTVSEMSTTTNGDTTNDITDSIINTTVSEMSITTNRDTSNDTTDNIITTSVGEISTKTTKDHITNFIINTTMSEISTTTTSRRSTKDITNIIDTTVRATSTMTTSSDTTNDIPNNVINSTVGETSTTTNTTNTTNNIITTTLSETATPTNDIINVIINTTIGEISTTANDISNNTPHTVKTSTTTVGRVTTNDITNNIIDTTVGEPSTAATSTETTNVTNATVTGTSSAARTVLYTGSTLSTIYTTSAISVEVTTAAGTVSVTRNEVLLIWGSIFGAAAVIIAIIIVIVIIVKRRSKSVELNHGIALETSYVMFSTPNIDEQSYRELDFHPIVLDHIYDEAEVLKDRSTSTFRRSFRRKATHESQDNLISNPKHTLERTKSGPDIISSRIENNGMEEENIEVQTNSKNGHVIDPDDDVFL